MGRPRIPEARVAATCPICGKVFTYKRSTPKTTCSRTCYLASLPKKLATTCPTCGKEFTYHQSWPRKYCSNVCKGRANVHNLPNVVPSRFTATCEQCGKQFETTPKATRGRFCSRRCWGDWLRDHLPRGEASPRYKQKFGRSALPPSPVTLICPVCEKPFESKPSHRARRRCCSRRCYARWMSESGLFSGPNSAVWLGGCEPYYGPTWEQARKAARARDRVCVDCGIGPDELGRELDVHHRVPFRTFGIERHSEANDLANLVTLCPTCHTRREWSENRSVGENSNESSP